MVNMLEIRKLTIRERSTGKVIIPDSSFDVKKGSCLAIVGESGSGKSLTCRAIMRLNKPGIEQAGDIWLGGENLAKLPEQEMRRRRGRRLCMIMQHGMRAFDPSRAVGVHLIETLAEHFDWSKSEMTGRMKRALESVRLNAPMDVMNAYPHQLSGGMLQRVMIALTLVLEPDVVIADEPTTALDTVSQYEVVEQFIRLRERLGSTMIFISHDLGVVRKIADEVLVMKDGRIVEHGTTGAVFTKAQHDYTRSLVTAKLSLHQHFRQVMGE
ncbi:staphylopine uptake ABC transporter ATP-binding protein CntD [Paenibacillus nanensis]|uniref:staphylopine uptake ABC transporter ATP-binding protein CntD n=1 Tax=Paenibacillus nanensis TaxID=393251 RepID=UPI00198082D7|nr:ABC transporter ATP-binding protein [Paenibacillus nanensis]